MKDVTPLWDGFRKNCRIKNEFVLGAFGEFWGTFVLVLFAVSGGFQAWVIQSVYFFPVLGEALGLMIAVTVFGGASGAHVNPAVTLALAVTGKCGWAKVPLYWFMQFFGGYVGAALGYGLYADLVQPGFSDVPGGSMIFAPLAHDRIGIALLDQIVGTAILVIVIHAAIDERNMRVPKFFYGFLFASTLVAINLVLKVNAGAVVNPARDISARLMAVTVGFKYVFATAGNDQYWLATFFGPLIGGVLGGFIYVVFVGAHLHSEHTLPSHDRNQNTNYGGQQGRSDWRSTEFVPYGGGGRQGVGPPPNSKPPKKEKKGFGNFGLGDAMKAGNLANEGFGMVNDFDPSAMENMGLQDVMDAREMAMDARDMVNDARDLRDAYRGQRNQGQGGGGPPRGGGYQQGAYNPNNAGRGVPRIGGYY